MSERALHILLLVEDDTAKGSDTRDLLTLEHGSSMRVHATPMREASAAIETQRFDVILLDASSSSKDGAAAVAHLHAAAPDVPIILLAGVEDELTRVRALQEGAQDVLTKGECSSGALVRAIRYAIERKRADENGRRLLRERAARAEAESSEKRARLLVRAGRVLASPLEIEVTLQNVASSLVGVLGDGCVFDLLEDGGEIRCGAVAHAAEGVEDKIRDARKNGPPENPEEHPVLRAIRKNELAILRGGKSSRELGALFGGAITATEAIVIPLFAREKILGAVTFSSRASVLPSRTKTWASPPSSPSERHLPSTSRVSTADARTPSPSSPTTSETPSTSSPSPRRHFARAQSPKRRGPRISKK
ncbi:MAG: response regulator [Polyangiaceae bacterium]